MSRKFEIRKAARKKAKLRMGLGGASGFGKTYSALLIAFGITGDWTKITLIDTENRSADLYSDLGEFNVLPFDAPYPPEAYIEAINAAENAGSEVIIIDSITHEWDGEGGCLQIVDGLGGRYQDWGKVTPRHNKFIQAILKSNCHVITTVRKKQDYDMVKNERGRLEVKKVGLKEVTREGFEYELTLNFELMNDNHQAKASKDRTGLFMKKDGTNEPFIPTIETGQKLANWASSGVDEVEYICKSISDVKNRNDLLNIWKSNSHLQSNKKVIAKFVEIGLKYPAPPKDEKNVE